jgi:hypothetical protein
LQLRDDPNTAFEPSLPPVVPDGPPLPAEEVCGFDRGVGYDVRGDNVAGYGGHGEPDSGVGVYGVTTAAGEGVDGGYGVAGTIECGDGVGVLGRIPEGIGIWGDSTIGGRPAIGDNTAIAGSISIGGDTTIGGHADVSGDLSDGTPLAAPNPIGGGDTSVDARLTIGAVSDRGRSPLRRARSCRCDSPLDALTPLAQRHGGAAVVGSVLADRHELDVARARAFPGVVSAREQLTPIAVDSVDDAARTRSE